MASSLERIIIDWMSNKGASEWHGVAVNRNWDNGLEPLLWIVDQAGCDRATALTLFWMCDPYYYMDEGHRAYDPREEGHELVHQILGNWGRYRTARFKFRLPWQVRHLESESYGLSTECLEALRPMLVETDGRERYPEYGPNGPAECSIAYKELSGEAVSDLDRELLAQERAGRNLSATDEELAASHQRELEESLSELEDLLSTHEKYTRKGE
jgi:hypothetical protein